MESMKMYSFLLAEAARPLSDTVEKAQNQKPKAGGHKGMDASAESLQAWEQLLNAANAITQVDLRSYYRSEADVQGIALCLFDVVRLQHCTTPYRDRPPAERHQHHLHALFLLTICPFLTCFEDCNTLACASAHII
jgi:hypothetical protein